jgi:hypothetical protein
MRTIITSILLIIGLGVEAASADPYRWCAEGVNGCGTSSCYFRTLEQCRAAAAGHGGNCSLNPFYTASDEGAPRPSKKKK